MTPEQHYLDFNKAFEESKCRYFPGTKIVSFWNGFQFWKIFSNLGHSKSSHKECKCQEKR